MIGRTRPSACPEGHPVRRNGPAWWCWTCDREVPALEPARPSLARRRVKPLGSPERMAWLHSLPCVGHGAPGHVCDPWDMDQGRAVIQAVHVRARGAGGGAGPRGQGGGVRGAMARALGIARQVRS